MQRSTRFCSAARRMGHFFAIKHRKNRKPMRKQKQSSIPGEQSSKTRVSAHANKGIAPPRTAADTTAANSNNNSNGNSSNNKVARASAAVRGVSLIFGRVFLVKSLKTLSFVWFSSTRRCFGLFLVHSFVVLLFGYEIVANAMFCVFYV